MLREQGQMWFGLAVFGGFLVFLLVLLFSRGLEGVCPAEDGGVEPAGFRTRAKVVRVRHALR